MRPARPPLPRRHPPVLTIQAAAVTLLIGVGLLAVMIGIAWWTTNVAWFLFFPVLLLGTLAALAVGVLWGLRHF